MNTDDVGPVEIAVARDGSRALAIMEYEGVHRLDRFDGVGIYFGIQGEPKGSLGRVAVVVDHLEYAGIRHTVQHQGADLHSVLSDIGLFSIGVFLDSEDPIELTPSGTNAAKIPVRTWFDDPWDTRPPQSTDDAVLAFIASKLYWGWRYGLKGVQFGAVEAKRMSIPVREFSRIAIAGEGKYWEASSENANAFSPTARLIQDFASGIAPGAGRPTMLAVVNRLGSPRYEASRVHLEKAIEFLNGPSLDMPNAVKEATAAVESLAIKVLGMSSGTLGDAIKELRGRGLLTPALAKAFEGLWGYSSEEPGVRHGKSTVPGVREAEARLALDLAASAIGFLLIVDGS